MQALKDLIIADGGDWDEFVSSYGNHVTEFQMLGDRAPLEAACLLYGTAITAPQVTIALDSVNATTNVVAHTQAITFTGGVTTVTHAAMADTRSITIYGDVTDVGVLPNLATGTTPWEPLNRSTNEAAINDLNFTGLCYNISASGSHVGWYVGIDAGAPITVDTVRLTEWTNATYKAESWSAVYSTDGTTIQVAAGPIANPTHSNVGNEAVAQFAPITAQWWAVRCDSSNRPDFWVISEMELFDASAVTPDYVLMAPGSNYTVKALTPTTTEVTELAPILNGNILISGVGI